MGFVPKPPGVILRGVQRVCLHPIGWVLIPSGRRRFCRLCGQAQRKVGTDWVNVHRGPWL